MMRVFAAAIFCLLSFTTAEARPYSVAPSKEFDRHAVDGGGYVVAVTEARHIRKHKRQQRDRMPTRFAGGCRSTIDLDCLASPELKAKAVEIVQACGSKVVSAVAPRGNKSNHPIGRAVDLVGNPACIYAHLYGWPGGYSTDYGRVHHVHISYNPGGQEWGVRFAHGGQHRHRYASLR